MTDRFQNIFGDKRGGGRPSPKAELTARERSDAFIAQANAESHGSRAARKEVADRTHQMASAHHLVLDDGYFLHDLDGGDSEGELRGLYDEAGETLLGMVLFLYGEAFEANTTITFARFLPLAA